MCVRSVAELSHALSWGGAPEAWGQHSRAVVQASRQDSEEAARVLAEGARPIACLLDILAAMTVPVMIYLAINHSGAGAHGWGVAMSTDTALALGVLTVARSRTASERFC